MRLLGVLVVLAATTYRVGCDGCGATPSPGTADAATDAGPADASLPSYSLVFTTQPTPSISAGAPLPVGPVVAVQDNLGHVLSSGPWASATVVLTDSSGNGVLAGPTGVAASGGVATFPSNSLIFEKAGTRSIRATATVPGTGSASGLSAPVNVLAPSFSQVSILSGPLDPNGDVDGTANAAQLWNPNSLTTDGTSIYILEEDPSCVLRRYTIATGAVTTWAGQIYQCGSVDGPFGTNTVRSSSSMTTDGTFIYFGDRNGVRRAEIATGIVSTFAGQPGTAGYLDDLNALNARFSEVGGLYVQGTTLYVGDTGNGRIRTIDLSTSPYAVKTYAGDGDAGAIDNPNPLLASVGGVWAFTADATHLYFSDGTNLRQSSWSTGAISTVAPNLALTICGASYYRSLAVIGTEAYFSCQNLIEQAAVGTWSWSTAAGIGWSSGETDGPAGTSTLGSAKFAALGTDLYFTDQPNGALRVLSGSNVVQTLAGTADAGHGWVMNARAADTRYSDLQDFVSDGTHLIGFDFDTNRLPVVSMADGSTGRPLGDTWGLVSGDGQVLTMLGSKLYYIDPCKLWELDPSANTAVLLAGNGTCEEAEGSFAVARLGGTNGITSDQTSVYLSDIHAIKKVDLDAGTVSVLSGSPGQEGCVTGGAATSRFVNPGKMTYLNGKLYFSQLDCPSGAIVSVDTTTGESAIVVPNTTRGYVDGPLSAAQFSGDGAGGIPLTSDGISLYALDSDNGVVRVIDLDAGQVSTLYGSPLERWQVDGPLPTAREGAAAGDTHRTLYYGFGRLYVGSSRGIRVVH